MDAIQITEFVTALGFPIVISLLFLKYISTTQREMLKSLGELKGAINLLTQRLNNDIKL